MKQGTNLRKDLNVCSLKRLFDYLQETETDSEDEKFLKVIDVTLFVDKPLIISKSVNPSIFLWNQVNDPNLGIHDFLKIDKNVAEFKWVVVDQKIIPISNILDDYDPTMTTIEMVMEELAKTKKHPVYFVAEGYYDSNHGVHFCLTPFNDYLSCLILETLFGSKFIEDVKIGKIDFDSLDLKKYFNPDAVEYCNELYVDHFKKSLGMISVSA